MAEAKKSSTAKPKGTGRPNLLKDAVKLIRQKDSELTYWMKELKKQRGY